MSRVGNIRVAVMLAALLTAIACIMALSAPKAHADHGAIVEHQGAGLGFGVQCDPVHEFDNVDPILGGTDHNHAFDGGGKFLDITNNTSPQDLRQANNTSCRHSNDRALYWTPKASGTAPAVQTQVNYYQPRPSGDNSGYNVIPAGLRMIAGAVPNDGSQAVPGSLAFGCQGAPASADHVVDCGTDRVKVEVDFPNCVERDGSGNLLLTSSNGRSHVHYGDPQTGNCQGNALKIPQLKEHWIYDANNGSEISWSVPDYDFHADFMNGWVGETFGNAVDICINGAQNGCQRISN